MKNKNKKSKAKDIVVLIALPILAASIAWYASLNYFVASLLLLAPPSLYLILRNRTPLIRVLFFSLVLSFAGFSLDYAAEFDGSWSVPTIFPFRLVGVVPVENIVWFFLLTFLIIYYFEFFYDHVKHRTIGKHMPYLYTILILTTIWFVLTSMFIGHIYVISYFYLKIGLFLCLLPILAFIFEFPRYISIFLKTAPYFIALNFLQEILGLHNGFWSFPGNHFIGWVHLGVYTFPYEELIFWIVLFNSSIIVYFELFDDNRLKLRWRTKARL